MIIAATGPHSLSMQDRISSRSRWAYGEKLSSKPVGDPDCFLVDENVRVLIGALDRPENSSPASIRGNSGELDSGWVMPTSSFAEMVACFRNGSNLILST